MKSWLLKVSSYWNLLRVCACCGWALGQSRQSTERFDSRGEFSLCPSCWETLNAPQIESGESTYPFPVRTLCVWGEANSKVCRHLLLALKGGGPARIYAPFAVAMSELMAPISTHGTTIVPSPAQQNFDRPDHAEQLAKALAAVLSAEYWPCLGRMEGVAQKSRSFHERWGAERLKLKEGLDTKTAWGRASHSRRLIFVDDVITTGATASSAYRALGQPGNFEVWTIFRRPRLR